jgi:hypothetical protein
VQRCGLCAARHELLEREGLEHHPDIPGYTLADLQMKYRKPLNSQDLFLVTVAIERERRARCEFSQRIIKLHSMDPEQDQVLPPHCRLQRIHARRSCCFNARRLNLAQCRLQLIPL